jgi:hypothetical protein
MAKWVGMESEVHIAIASCNTCMIVNGILAHIPPFFPPLLILVFVISLWFGTSNMRTKLFYQHMIEQAQHYSNFHHAFWW